MFTYLRTVSVQRFLISTLYVLLLTHAAAVQADSTTAESDFDEVGADAYVDQDKLSTQAFPEPEEFSTWELMLDRDGVQIYTQPWAGSDFVAFKTVQTVSADLKDVLAHFTDVSGFNAWIPNLKSARLIREFDDSNERSIYLHLGMPWPLYDRDSVIGQRVGQDEETLVVKIEEWSEARSLPERDGLVRVPMLMAEIFLMPLRLGQTKIIWQVHNEPGGSIPSFLVNWMVESIFFESSVSTRAIVEDDALQPSSKQFAWLKEPISSP